MIKKANSHGVRTLFSSPEVLCLLNGNRIEISGNLNINESGRIIRAITKNLGVIKHSEIIIDLDRVKAMDSAGVTTLEYIRKQIEPKGRRVYFEGGSREVVEKIKLFSKETKKADIPGQPGFLEQTGQSVYDFFSVYIYGYLLLAANVSYWAASDLFKKKTTRKGEFVNQSVQIGVNAALIIILLSFAIGLVLSVQSAVQLKYFGADIYIVDLVVISMMSEMGPLITAIMISGRSGSAIAAEIASMKVSSELDALTTMGLNPIRFVVVPKLYAALFTMPFLMIIATVTGIVGGATAAYLYLDITPEIFINRMGEVMQYKDLFTGFVKSQVYASIIVLTGSFYGFSVDRGAEGVGRVTTMAVVVSISLVVLADSVLGVLFY